MAAPLPVICLAGPTGCGKTTLLKTINKLISIDSGDVIINGVNVRELDETQLPKKIGYVVQEGGLFPHMTIEDNIALTMKLAEWPEDKIHDRVTEMLQLVNLDPEAYRNLYPSQLSGGQRQAMSLLMSTMTPIDFLILDEHTAALDPKTAELIMELTDKVVREKQLTTIMVTHNLRYAVEYGDRLLMMHQGHAVMDLEGDEKKNMNVDTILEKFNEISIECGN